MIDYLIGTVKGIKEQSITVFVNGVGFNVFTPKVTNIENNKPVELYSYMHWNAENGPSLYGFKEELERTVFLMIIDCPKIGPKIALSVLQQMSANEFLEVISTQDEKLLSSVNGIGEKKAENIIMQLKHKVSKLIASGDIKPAAESDFAQFQTLNDALTTLGYNKQEITKAIQKLTKETAGESLKFDQLMRRALAFLSKGA